MPKGRRIALIEDDEIMGGSISQRLTLEGAEVIWLKLAQRAIAALARRAKPDLVRGRAARNRLPRPARRLAHPDPTDRKTPDCHDSVMQMMSWCYE